MMLLLLLACGFDGPLDAPSPPPAPPPTLATQDANVVTYTGVVHDVSPATRTWTTTGDGRRLLCFLTDHGVLEMDGRVIQVEELPDGRTVQVEGREDGDLLLVSRAVVAPIPPEVDPAAPPAASPADGAAPTPGIAAPASAAPPAAAAPSAPAAPAASPSGSTP